MSNPQRELVIRTEDFLRQETLKLAKILLPTLDPQVVESARQRTGLSFLTPATLDGYLLQIQPLQARRSELEASPEFQLAPAEARRAAQEELGRLAEFQAALGPFVQQCLAHPRFQILLEVGYGTTRYATPFWRYSFYLDRRAASELCASTGRKDFSTLLAEFESAQDSLQTLQARQQRISATDLSAREEWEQLGRQIQKLQTEQLSTLQTRMQLALLKGGEILELLKSSSHSPEIRGMLATIQRLRDQLDEYRNRR